MKGTTKARIHDVFAKRIQELQTQAEQLAAGERVWQVPEELATQDLLDIAHLHEPAFDRESLNTNFAETIQSADDPGTVGDMLSLKTQIDYIAMLERAFRARHASLPRCLAHHSGRRFGHGVGGVFPAVRRQAEDLIRAGGLGQSANDK